MSAPAPIVLTLWVIYDRPKDYPNSFVLRRQYVDRNNLIWADRNPVAIGDALEAIRTLIPVELHNMNRMPNDDPAIAEVWI